MAGRRGKAVHGRTVGFHAVSGSLQPASGVSHANVVASAGWEAERWAGGPAGALARPGIILPAPIRFPAFCDPLCTLGMRGKVAAVALSLAAGLAAASGAPSTDARAAQFAGDSIFLGLPFIDTVDANATRVLTVRTAPSRGHEVRVLR